MIPKLNAFSCGGGGGAIRQTHPAVVCVLHVRNCQISVSSFSSYFFDGVFFYLYSAAFLHQFTLLQLNGHDDGDADGTCFFHGEIVYDDDFMNQSRFVCSSLSAKSHYVIDFYVQRSDDVYRAYHVCFHRLSETEIGYGVFCGSGWALVTIRADRRMMSFFFCGYSRKCSVLVLNLIVSRALQSFSLLLRFLKVFSPFQFTFLSQAQEVFHEGRPRQ